MKKLKEKQGMRPSQKLDKEVLKKYFNQKTFAGISLVGLVIVFVLYVVVYLNMQTKTEELEAANEVKAREVAELEEYYNNLPQYKADIETMQQQMQEILAQYPADAREEDILMLAVDTQTANAIGYDSISMDTPEVVLDIPADVVLSAGLDEYTQQMQYVRKHAAFVNTTTYSDLKNVISEILHNDNRIAIDNIVYTKGDDTGLLDGNIDVYLYSVSGTGKEYVVPEIKAYPAGTDDIFQSSKNSGTVTESSDEADDDDAQADSTQEKEAD